MAKPLQTKKLNLNLQFMCQMCPKTTMQQRGITSFKYLQQSLSGSLSAPTQTYMWVSILRSQFVEVQQGLVDILLQLQGALQGLQPASPLIAVWFLRRGESKL
ncbi:hypothetical protein EYF80_031955 [Liparis tanakae]|uniref:Uncharacterized protein n=1 Tax=Liparis tanakae TaxID=230148 RepID=A0A4Z2GYM2_9TELE|nr:hypothetical protein EYF80_031955 [Liparis tanakae]